MTWRRRLAGWPWLASSRDQHLHGCCSNPLRSAAVSEADSDGWRAGATFVAAVDVDVKALLHVEAALQSPSQLLVLVRRFLLPLPLGPKLVGYTGNPILDGINVIILE